MKISNPTAGMPDEQALSHNVLRVNTSRTRIRPSLVLFHQ